MDVVANKDQSTNTTTTCTVLSTATVAIDPIQEQEGCDVADTPSPSTDDVEGIQIITTDDVDAAETDTQQPATDDVDTQRPATDDADGIEIITTDDIDAAGKHISAAKLSGANIAKSASHHLECRSTSTIRTSMEIMAGRITLDLASEATAATLPRTLDNSPRTRLLVYSLTVVHAVVTRSPITIIGLYARDDLGLSTFAAVMVMVCFSIGRSVAVQINSKFLSLSVMMTCCALQIVGTVMLALSSTMDIFKTILPLSVFIMGFAEIIAALDTLLKRSVNWWEAEAQQMLYRDKFGCIALGSGAGFLTGSYLYQLFGIVGGCCFIATAGVLHLVLTVYYVRTLLECQDITSLERMCFVFLSYLS